MDYRTAQQLVISAFCGHVFGMDPATGQRVWEFNSGGYDIVRLEIENTYVLGLGIGSGGAFCLSYETGQVFWHNKDIDGETLLIVGDRFIVGKGGELACYALNNGAKLWEEKFKGKGVGKVAIGVPGRVAQADRSRV